MPAARGWSLRAKSVESSWVMGQALRCSAVGLGGMVGMVSGLLVAKSIATPERCEVCGPSGAHYVCPSFHL